jgi:Anti-sigma-K factor rskA/Putative zinc-finger
VTDSRENSTHPDLTGYIFGLPGGEDQQAVRAHLQQCQACASEVREMGALPDLMGAAAPAVSVPATLEQRVLDAVSVQQTSTGPVPEGQQPPEKQRVRSRPVAGALVRGALARLGLGQLGRRRWVPGIAVAAAAMIVVAAAGVETVRLGQAPGAPGSAQATVQTIRLVAADGSAASGSASIQRSSSGQVVELNVKGLPQTTPGQLYVCWLVDEGDSLQHQNRVAVGTFSVSGSGPVTVRWSTGADTAQYRLDVTREQADGNPLRRGPEVLTAVR